MFTTGKLNAKNPKIINKRIIITTFSKQNTK